MIKQDSVVGGHPGRIEFDGNKLIKQTMECELMVYRAINGVSIDGDDKLTDDARSQLEKLKDLTPIYYSSEGDTIVIENMLYGHEGATFMDLKLGTSRYTLHAKNRQKDTVARAKKDASRFLDKWGYIITGYDCQGDVYDRFDYIITDRQQHLRKIFVYEGEFKLEAAKSMLVFVQKLIEYMKGCTFEIRSASLFIVMDFKNANYNVKQIDLNSFEDIGKLDEGFLFGLTKLADDINQLIQTG